jgi:5-methylcytosine-specific restriction endonuclease McrA
MPGDPFYASAAWLAIGRAVLSQRPFCQVPGCPERSRDVDHVKSRRSGGASLDPGNVQALCTSHHSQKTARQDRPAYRSSDKPLRAKGCGVDGLPVDPLHHWR